MSSQPTERFRRAETLRTDEPNPAHPAGHAPPQFRGSGTVWGTWIACEEPGRAEGRLTGGIELVMDALLAAGATVGQHPHPDTGELYLDRSGDLTETAGREAGPATTATGPEEVHRLGPGGWHSVTAGPNGARIIVITAKAAQ